MDKLTRQLTVNKLAGELETLSAVTQSQLQDACGTFELSPNLNVVCPTLQCSKSGLSSLERQDFKRRYSLLHERRNTLLQMQTPKQSNECLSYKSFGQQIVNGYVVLRTLGTGATSRVAQCMKIGSDSDDLYAMKIVKRSKARDSKTIRYEIEALKTVKHPNVLHIHEIIDDERENKIFLITDYLPEGTLEDKIATFETGIPTAQLKAWARDIASAIHYLHTVVDICHRDIKPDNIMLDADHNALLCDFGSALIIPADELDDTVNETVGTAAYFAPEMVRTTTPKVMKARQCDMWAFGATLYKLATG